MLCNCGLFKPQHTFKAGFIPLFTEGLGETRQPWEGMYPSCIMARGKAPFSSLCFCNGMLFNPGNCVKGWGFPAGRCDGLCACESPSWSPS